MAFWDPKSQARQRGRKAPRSYRKSFLSRKLRRYRSKGTGRSIKAAGDFIPGGDEMSVKVRISYEHPQELQRVLELLRPDILSCKAEEGQKGQYKRAYVSLQDKGEDAEKSQGVKKC